MAAKEMKVVASPVRQSSTPVQLFIAGDSSINRNLGR